MKIDICQPAHEYPIYKVRLWKSSTESVLYIWVGKSPKHAPLLRKIQQQGGSSLSSEETRLLKQDYGKNYRSKLGIQEAKPPHMLFETLYHDDTIQTVRRKIWTYLSAELTNPNVYMWIRRQTSNSPELARHFVTQLFRDRTTLSSAEFVEAFSHIAGRPPAPGPAQHIALTRDKALALFAEQSLSSVLEPVGFKYMLDGYMVYFPIQPLKASPADAGFRVDALDIVSEEAMLLESFTPMMRNELNVLPRDRTDLLPRQILLYFPQALSLSSTKSWQEAVKTQTKENDLLLSSIGSNPNIRSGRAQKDIALSCMIRYLHLRVHEGARENLPLQELFEMLETSEDVPMMYLSLAQSPDVDVKVHQPLLQGSQSALYTEQFANWLDFKTYKHKRNKDYLQIQLRCSAQPNSVYHVTLELFDTGHYDLKYFLARPTSLQDLRASFPDVNRFVTRVNRALRSVLHDRRLALPMVTETFWSAATSLTTPVRMVRMKTVVSMKSQGDMSLPSMAKLTHVFRSVLYPFFVILPTQDKTLHSIYKRTNHFSKQDQIFNFFTRKRLLSDEDRKEEARIQFGISDVEVQELHAQWKQDASNQKLVMPFLLGSKPVTVRINLFRNLEASITLDNVTSLVLQKRILTVLTTAFYVAASPEVLAELHKPGTSQKPGDLINQDMELNDMDLNDLSMDMDADDIFLQQFEDDLARTQDTQPAVESSAAPSAANSGPDAAPTGSTESGRQNFPSPFLKSLQLGDPDVFDGNGFASTCGWSDLRHPILISKREKDFLDSNANKNAYSHTGTLQYGSTEERYKNNFYICPEVWCPISRLPMSLEQFKAAGEKCPLENETPFNFMRKYFKNKKRYPGYLDSSKHPEKKYCMPCCFGRPNHYADVCTQDMGQRFSSSPPTNTTKITPFSRKPNAAAAAADKKNMNYIMNNYPMISHRFGLLPETFSKLLGSQGCTTGYLASGAKCFVRKGVDMSHTQSFLQCMIHDPAAPVASASITNVNQLIEAMVEDLTPHRFMQLNGGLTLKHFIAEEERLWDPTVFTEFVAWLKAEKTYVQMYGLEPLLLEVQQRKAFDPASPLRIAIQREFLIYQSYQRFLRYLRNPQQTKTHEWILDYWNLDPKKPNVLVFEYENGEVYLSCPVYRGRNELLRKNQPVIMLFRKDQFYEPIYQVSQDRQFSSKWVFHWDEDPCVRKIAALLKRVCTEQPNYMAESLRVALNARTATTIRRHVIDVYGRLLGFVTVQNVYVPLPVPERILTPEKGSSFAYADQILPALRPKASRAAVRDLFKSLNELFPRKFELDAKQSAEGDALVFEDGRQSPMQTNDAPTLAAWFASLRKDASVFTGHEERDARVTKLGQQKDVEERYARFRAELAAIIPYNSQLHDDLRVLWNPHHPYSSQEKRTWMRLLVQRLSQSLVLETRSDEPTMDAVQKASLAQTRCSPITRKQACNSVLHCKWVETWKKNPSTSKVERVGGRCKVAVPRNMAALFLDRFVDDLLRMRSLTQMKLSTLKRETESALFFQVDDKMDRAAVLKLLKDRMRTVLDAQKQRAQPSQADFATIRGKLEEAPESRRQRKLPRLASATAFEPLPTEWRTLLKDFEVAKMDDVLTPGTSGTSLLLDLFYRAAKTSRPELQMTPSRLQRLLLDQLHKEAEKDPQRFVAGMLQNDWVKSKKINLSDPEAILAVARQPDYMFGDFDLALLGDMLYVSVLVIGRKVTRFVDSLRCVNQQRHPVMLLLKHDYDAKNHCERYQLVLTRKHKKELSPKSGVAAWLFEASEFSEGMQQRVVEACQKYSIVLKQ